jgi:hypothetical protein
MTCTLPQSVESHSVGVDLGLAHSLECLVVGCDAAGIVGVLVLHDAPEDFVVEASPVCCTSELNRHTILGYGEDGSSLGDPSVDVHSGLCVQAPLVGIVRNNVGIARVEVEEGDLPLRLGRGSGNGGGWLLRGWLGSSSGLCHFSGRGLLDVGGFVGVGRDVDAVAYFAICGFTRGEGRGGGMSASMFE